VALRVAGVQRGGGLRLIAQAFRHQRNDNRLPGVGPLVARYRPPAWFSRRPRIPPESALTSEGGVCATDEGVFKLIKAPTPAVAPTWLAAAIGTSGVQAASWRAPPIGPSLFRTAFFGKTNRRSRLLSIRSSTKRDPSFRPPSVLPRSPCDYAWGGLCSSMGEAPATPGGTASAAQDEPSRWRTSLILMSNGTDPQSKPARSPAGRLLLTAPLHWIQMIAPNHCASRPGLRDRMSEILATKGPPPVVRRLRDHLPHPRALLSSRRNAAGHPRRSFVAAGCAPSALFLAGGGRAGGQVAAMPA